MEVINYEAERGLLQYLQQGEERANEDQAVHYFRAMFGADFSRQKNAEKADGYVAGHLVIELKGKTRDWFAGLCQAIAYRRNELDFCLVIVAAKNFLAVWDIADLPRDMIELVMQSEGAASTVGERIARVMKSSKVEILRQSLWQASKSEEALFHGTETQQFKSLEVFKEVVKTRRKTRKRINLKNFCEVIQEMVPFFGDTP